MPLPSGFKWEKLLAADGSAFLQAQEQNQQVHLSLESVKSQETEILRTLAINIYVGSKNLRARIIVIATIKVAEATII